MANLCQSLHGSTPTTMRKVEVEIRGFPGTDLEQLNKHDVLFEKLKQGEEPVAV